MISDEANSLEAAIDRVFQIVDTNLGRTVDYAALSEPCTDSEALFYMTRTDLGSSNGSDCISISENFNKFRVRLPDQVLETYFGPVVGTDTHSVSGSAEAERNAEFGCGGNVPFYVLNATNA